MSSDPLYPSWIGSIRFIASHSLCLLTVLPCSAWHKVTRVYGCTFFTSQGALYQPPLKRHPQDSDHVLLHRKCESRVKAGTQRPVHRGLWLCLWYQKTVGREEGRRKREGKKKKKRREETGGKSSRWESPISSNEKQNSAKPRLGGFMPSIHYEMDSPANVPRIDLHTVLRAWSTPIPILIRITKIF